MYIVHCTVVTPSSELVINITHSYSFFYLYPWSIQALSGESPEKMLNNLQIDMKKFESDKDNSDYSHKLQLVEEFVDKPGQGNSENWLRFPFNYSLQPYLD